MLDFRARRVPCIPLVTPQSGHRRRNPCPPIPITCCQEAQQLCFGHCQSNRWRIVVLYKFEMGSLPEKVNLLEYLRSRSHVDCDSLDIQRESPLKLNRLRESCSRADGYASTVATELGPFVDCTSNQARHPLSACGPAVKPYRPMPTQSFSILRGRPCSRSPQLWQSKFTPTLPMSLVKSWRWKSLSVTLSPANKGRQ